MGWLDSILRKPKRKSYAMTLDGYTPIFSQFGTNIYASDVVQQALKCIVDEMKKLKPAHIRMNGSDPVPVNSNVQYILDNPNQLMTTSEFLEKTMWLMLMNYNAFIVPTYYVTESGNKVYDGIYPINPTQVDFKEDAAGRLSVVFTFVNGYKTEVLYDDVIHIKYNYSVNEYMGGDHSGQADHTALLETLNLNKALLTGISRSMNASYAVNGIVKYNTLLDDGKMEKAIQDFENKLRNNESGIIPIDMKSEFVPVARNISMIDEPTLKFIDEKILRNWGVPLPILTGDFTKEQYEAFYQKTLEPIVISISQAFTKKLFTPRERAFGNKIELHPKDLIFMTVAQTLEMINILSPTGALYENEKRVALGLPPKPELEGKRFMSLNWIDAENATRYQTGLLKEGEPDEQQK